MLDAMRNVRCSRHAWLMRYAHEMKLLVGTVGLKKEPSIDELLDRLIIGDVEMCIERAVSEIRDARVNDLVIQAKLGDLPHNLAMGSLQLWTEEVVPGIEQELGMSIKDVNEVGVTS